MYIPEARKTLVGLTGIILSLLLLNIISFLNVHINDLGQNDAFFKMTNFNTEKNIPSVFSSLLHFLASICLGFVALSKLTVKKFVIFWWTMSFIFLFLGLDELLRIHENISGHTGVNEQDSGPFLYTWILYYMGGLLLLGIFFFKPLFQLPRKTLLSFIFAGILFVLGAVVLENVAGKYIWSNGIQPDVVQIIPEIFIMYSIEEFLEMFGVSFFIYSILKFLHLYRVPVVIKKVTSS
ncbi:hypothetical protein FK178_06750 [Antarcticibacterium arcticum]|uniref:Uncharacterized protein n=1 Tax=Antarcticibacterium arcticum TaxID=2585771 RepID=A0A5B8YKW0_9FLAO|nr:hypothetical protein [Antarcticibacterium arcticum]QED37437.1 hypothetical protein FK178_06750 [Antarcticibacterium arcticum]